MWKIIELSAFCYVFVKSHLLIFEYFKNKTKQFSMLLRSSTHFKFFSSLFLFPILRFTFEIYRNTEDIWFHAQSLFIASPFICSCVKIWNTLFVINGNCNNHNSYAVTIYHKQMMWDNTMLSFHTFYKFKWWNNIKRILRYKSVCSSLKFWYVTYLDLKWSLEHTGSAVQFLLPSILWKSQVIFTSNCTRWNRVTNILNRLCRMKFICFSFCFNNKLNCNSRHCYYSKLNVIFIVLQSIKQ